MGSCLEVGAPFGMLGQGWRDGWQPGYRANGFAGVEAPVEDGGAIVGGGESSVGCGVGEQVEWSGSSPWRARRARWLRRVG